MRKSNHIEDDIFLFEETKKGCSDSFEQLYNLYASRLYTYGKKICYDSPIIEDTIHDVFLKVWNKKSTIQIKQSFSSYLFKTFKRDLICRIKQEKHRETFLDKENDFSVERSFLDILFENQIEISNETKVRNAINNLNTNQREVIYLRFIEGMTTKNIAEQLDITVGGVHNLYSKAFKNILTFLNQHVEMILIMLYSSL